MNEIRKKICDECNGFTCKQNYFPISKEEWEELGVSPNDSISDESVLKMMYISCKPECVQRMLERHPLEWWVKELRRY